MWAKMWVVSYKSKILLITLVLLASVSCGRTDVFFDRGLPQSASSDGGSGDDGGGSKNDGGITENDIKSVSFEKSTYILRSGESVKTRLNAKFKDGTSKDVTKDKNTTLEFETKKGTKTKIAEYETGSNRKGFLAGNDIGEGTAIGVYMGKAARASVSVVPGALIGLEPEEQLITLRAGSSREAPFKVTGLFDNGANPPYEVDLTGSAKGTHYEIADGYVASTDKDGGITAISKGETYLIIYNDYDPTITAEVTIHVTETEVEDFSYIYVDPSYMSLSVGDYSYYTVWGVTPEGGQIDVTYYENLNLNCYSYDNENIIVEPVSPGTIAAKSSGVGYCDFYLSNSKGVTLSTTLTVEVADYREIVSLNISPDKFYIEYNGEPVYLSITALYSDGSSEEVNRSYDLTVYAEYPEKIMVDNSGEAYCVGGEQGEYVYIYAYYQGFEASAAAIIQRKEKDRLLSLSIEPLTFSLELNDTLQFKVYGYFSISGERDLSTSKDGTAYDVSDPSALYVDKNGLATAIGESSYVTVTAFTTLDSSLIATSQGEIINPAILVGVTLTPKNIILPKNGTAQLKLTARYSNLTTEDVTNDSEVYFESFAPDTATVQSKGLVTAVAKGGPIAIKGSYKGYYDYTSVTVEGRQLTSLTVSPNPVSTELGKQEQLKVTGYYDDSSSADITASSNGTKYAETGGTILQLDTEGGFKSTTAGSTTITVENSGKKVAVPVTVVEPAIVSIRIAPDEITLPQIEGIKYPLKLYAKYASGTEVEITSVTGVVWYSMDEAICKVSSKGEVTPGKVGTTNVSATYKSLSDAIKVTVTSEIPRDFVVVPEPVVTSLGQNVQLHVYARFSDGSQTEITDIDTPYGRVTYQSANSRIASVDAHGLITPVGIGETDITITFGSLGYSHLVHVTVTPPALQSIDLVVARTTLLKGEKSDVFVYAKYADGSSSDISKDPNLKLTIDPEYSTTLTVISGPAVYAIGPGKAELKADYKGFVDSAWVQVLYVPPTLNSIDISPPSAKLNITDTLQLTVTGYYSDGSSRNVTSSAMGTTYQSDNTTIATVSTNGLITAHAAGNANITATNSSKSDSIAVSVAPNQVQLVSIEATPNNFNLSVGSSQQLTVIGKYTDGSTRNLTLQATGTTYAPQQSGILYVSVDGVVTGLKDGFAIIRVINNGIYTDVYVTVKAAPITLVSLEITPSPITMNVNEVVQLKVMGKYSDGSTRDLTKDPNMQYSSASPSIATISTIGEVTGKSKGSTPIIARYENIYNSVQVTVKSNEAQLTSISVQPMSYTFRVGETKQLVVTGYYSDGSSKDITKDPALSYSSSDSTIVGVNTTGLTTALKEGGVNITIIYGSNASLFTRASVKVLPAGGTLDRIVITPSSFNIAIGSSKQLAVYAYYTDGTSIDITYDPQISYTSSNSSIATVSSTGNVTGLTSGKATITALYNGKSSTSECSVQIGPAPTLVSITVEPGDNYITAGETRQLKVTGKYSDGSTQDLTKGSTGTTYTVLDPSLLTVSGDGMIKGIAAGSTGVKALNSGKIAYAWVTITRAPAKLVYLWVDPDYLNITTNQTYQLHVYGYYQDDTGSGYQQEITPSSYGTTYRSSDSKVVRVSTEGLVTGVNPGYVSITVANSGMTATTWIDVSYPTPFISSISPSEIPVGSPDTKVTIKGGNFTQGLTIIADTIQIPADSVTSDTVIFTFSSKYSNRAHVYDLYVRTTDWYESNHVSLSVVGTPNIDYITPDNGFQGQIAEFIVVGSNLQNCILSESSNQLLFSNVSIATDGTRINAIITVDDTATIGPHMVTVTCPKGTDAAIFTVNDFQSLEDLIVESGETITLSGENTYRNIYINEGGTVKATGQGRLVLRAIGDFIISGTIDVRGEKGVGASTVAASGGAGGAGGGGGGGGADGNTSVPAKGGIGSPNGQDAGTANMRYTKSGSGGSKNNNTGAGQSVEGTDWGCGEGGGGGSWMAYGGWGGGASGDGTGGASGEPYVGSDFDGGTGGGGGGTCDKNSGGGGGGGGGTLMLQVVGGTAQMTISYSASILAGGGDGGAGGLTNNISYSGGGGGGSGGTIHIWSDARPVTIEGTLNVSGGNGGTAQLGHGGGGGSGGYIGIVMNNGILTDYSADYVLDGGTGGTTIQLPFPIPGIQPGNSGTDGEAGYLDKQL